MSWSIHARAGESVPISNMAIRHTLDSRVKVAPTAKPVSVRLVMVENWWRLGLELGRLEFAKNQHATPQGERHLTLGDLGINDNQSARCQKLAEHLVYTHYRTRY